MKKVYVVLLLFIFTYSQADVANNTFYYTNQTLKIRISSDSVNRIVFPLPLVDKIYSKEKNLNIQINGYEAYIKVVPIKKTKLVDNNAVESKIEYSTQPAEVYFITNDNKTYSIVFVPDKIDTRTIYIKDNLVKKKDVSRIEKFNSDYAKNIIEIFKLSINNNITNNYEEKIVNQEYSKFYHISNLEGQRFTIFKFYLENKDDSETIEKINRSINNQISATALFENNYFVLGVKDE